MKKEWSPTTFDKKNSYYNEDWHNYYDSIISLIPHNSSVLEIGCGRGGLLEYLRDKKNCRILGVDISDDAVIACREKGIRCLKLDIEENVIDGTYDVVILSAILEHTIDPISLLKKLNSNLNVAGYIIIGVPNFSYLFARIQYLIGINIKCFGDSIEDKKIGIQPYGHIQFFNKKTVVQILKNSGYIPVKWSYFKPPPRHNTSFLKFIFKYIIYKLNLKNEDLISQFIAVKAKSNK